MTSTEGAEAPKKSAQGLFRAIRGRAARERSAPLLGGDAPQVRKPVKLREAHDFYPTGDTDAINGLLALDGARIAQCGTVWESACGAGHMVAPIRAHGLPCIASDLIDRGCPASTQEDYFAVTSSRARAIITNPPYNLINARDGRGAWLRHSLAMPDWDYMALLLSWDWPAARANGLGDLLDAHPFSYCYLMRWKLDFTGAGAPPQRNAWFIWDRSDPRGYDAGQREPSFRFMDRAHGKNLSQAAMALGGAA